MLLSGHPVSLPNCTPQESSHGFSGRQASGLPHLQSKVFSLEANLLSPGNYKENEQKGNQSFTPGSQYIKPRRVPESRTH